MEIISDIKLELLKLGKKFLEYPPAASRKLFFWGWIYVFYATRKNENLNKCVFQVNYHDENKLFFDTSELTEGYSYVALFLFLLKDLLIISVCECLVGLQ